MRKIIYEIAMGILAVFAVILAIIGISTELNKWQTIADNAILVIFIIDYFTRLFLSKDKQKFLKDNILDLIAIIPFNSIFRAFRLVKLTKILKLAKLLKVLVYMARLIKRTEKFFNTNGFKYMVSITLGFIVLGGLLIHYAEEMSFQDGLWWAFVTATTVGYGDISPKTTYGRAIAIVLMIVGIGLVGSLTSTITSYFINNKKHKTVKEDILEDIKDKIDDVENLSDEDIDNICSILKSLNR